MICNHPHDRRTQMCRVCSNKQLKHASTAPAEERFWKLVDESGPCWVWLGSKDKRGYGRFRPTTRANPVLAHRFAYELFGEIPEGLCLDHLCRNPSCVNPDHLEPVTQKENVRRGWDARKA